MFILGGYLIFRCLFYNPFFKNGSLNYLIFILGNQMCQVLLEIALAEVDFPMYIL